jgi:cell division GTPase FtsZ
LAPAFARALGAQGVQVIAAVRTPFVSEVLRTFTIEEAEIRMIGESGDE